MSELWIHHVKVIVHTQQGEEVVLYEGMPGHPTTHAILDTIARYHAFDAVEDMLTEWYGVEEEHA